MATGLVSIGQTHRGNTAEMPQPVGQREGAADMSPPRARADTDDGISVNWKGVTFFVQNTGALGILAAALFYIAPRMLDINDKFDKVMEREAQKRDAEAEERRQILNELKSVGSASQKALEMLVEMRGMK